jgi:hypothetical protein
VARWLVERGIPQDALKRGLIDTQFMAAIFDDTRGSDPTPKLIRKRRYWASACGQIVKVLFALVGSDDPRVQQSASWAEAIQQAEKVAGRSERDRKAHTSFHPWLRRFRRALHMQAAIEIGREFGSPRSADALMLNAMVVHQRLHDWHLARRFRGTRNDYLEADAFWAWSGMGYDDDHGVPALWLGYESLTPRGTPGRPLAEK